MTKLERRSRLLLRAYPAAYRDERGEEIVATLLEASSDDRSRPSLRDAGALIFGGLQARAAQHRRLSAAANIRLAVLLGVAIYLSLAAVSYLTGFVDAELSPNTAGIYSLTGLAGWLAVLTGLLTAAAVLLAWFSRRAVVIAAVLASGAAIAYSWSSWRFTLGFLFCQLVSLAVLAILARRAERPAPSWLWLIGLIVAANLVPAVSQQFAPAFAYGLLLLSVLILSIAWIAIDARPAIGVATYLVLLTLQQTVDVLRFGQGIWVPYQVLIVAAVVAAPAVWRLRGQSVRAVP